MQMIIIYLTFIPWALYYVARIYDALKGTKSNKINFKWLKSNLSKIFHIEDILLIAIFVYFSGYGNEGLNLIVNEMLFVVTNLYLFVNVFYDKRVVGSKKLEKKDIRAIIIVLLISLIPFVYFISTKNQINMYYILYGFAFGSYPIALISRFIDNLIRKIVKR